MDRFLSFTFFKQQKFPTKQEGIEFIETQPKLKQFMVKCNADIEDYKSEKITEFEMEFEKYDEQKQSFLRMMKDKRKDRKEEKRELEKQCIKQDLRAEILQELEREREMEIVKAHSDLYPIYDKTNINIDLDQIFVNLIKNKDKLSNKDIKEVAELKKKTETVMGVLTIINERLLDIQNNI